jgi:predicted glutamine amidotransferase
MCRWLTYCGAPIYIDTLLFEPEHSLVQQSLNARKAAVTTQGDGFGLGWYGERSEPGLYRETLPAWNDRNLRSLAHQIRAPLFFAHVRASTGTDTARANCHPFARARWLFMHNGVIGGYERLRRRLEALIPDALYPFRNGTTDSEILFLLLFRHGVEADPLTALAAMLAELRAEMAASGIAEPLRFTAALSDGERVIATRYASDDRPPTLYWCNDGDTSIVVSEPLDADKERWNEVPPGYFLVAARGAAPTLVPIMLSRPAARRSPTTSGPRPIRHALPMRAAR